MKLQEILFMPFNIRVYFKTHTVTQLNQLTLNFENKIILKQIKKNQEQDIEWRGK